jgi:DNA-binding CsgD family transcriptional regulator/PAS domain-containing protein
MDRTPHALDLIGRIYDAAAEPGLWRGFVEGFSEALGGSAVALSFDLPGLSPADRRFAAEIDVQLAGDCADAFVRDLPRTSRARLPFARGFALVHASADDRIESSASRESWRKPGELADAPPMGHLIAIEDGRPVASIVAYRKRGRGAFDDSDLAFANRLASHLGRAFELYRMLAGATHQRRALAEVMNRLPAGVVLLNDEGRVVLCNRSANRILGRSDGLFLADDMLHAEDAAAEAILQRRIAEATAEPPNAESTSRSERRSKSDEKSEKEIPRSLAACRTSGDGAYVVSVARLLPGRTVRDAVASVILTDPEIGLDPAVELLRNLHDLTPAETELVSHLARGRSLEETAQARGVSINTARSQLKVVFSKTGTSRQGELLQLVLRCLLPMAEE